MFLAKGYLFKFSNISIRKKCEIYSKLTIQTAEHRPCRLSFVFVVNFEQISHLFLEQNLMILSMYLCIRLTIMFARTTKNNMSNKDNQLTLTTSAYPVWL